ncbi:MAG TPA: hypothetical protein VFI62_00415 [Burkholderiales bacterium]|nr:hypothetical protein [Burkholderiales bacterium]
MVWLYVETRDTEKIAQIAGSTFWLVLATLPMFLALQYFLKSGLGFYGSLGIAIAIMAGCYALAVPLLARYGISM